MARCGGCNCDFPTDSGSPNQWGQGKHPCCGNSTPGTTSTYNRLPCGYAVIFGCEHPWWKHQTPTTDGPKPMLVPPGYYEGVFTSEPSATYAVTFLGRECVHGECYYIQREGLGPYPPTHPQCGNPGCASLYHRVCNLKQAASNSFTGRRPYYIDPTTGAMVYAPMTFDLRFNNDRLRALFGGNDDDNPRCCWCPPAQTNPECPVQSCIVEWTGWKLHLDPTDTGPYARPTPRLTYLEGSEAFWNEVGRPEPWYGFDYSFQPAGFQPWANGANQFALQNADYWPSLPARVCVVPVRWPYFNSPFSDDDQTCKSCAPAILATGGGGPPSLDCPQGLYVDWNLCPNGDGTISGGAISVGCSAAGLSPDEFKPTLPDGVDQPADAWWWKSAGQNNDVECTEGTPDRVGVLTYHDGTSWKVRVYCSHDSGETWEGGTVATVSNVECGCAGVSFSWEASGIDCICCACCDCDTVADPLTAEWSTTGGDSATITLNKSGCVWSGSGTTAFGNTLDVALDLEACCATLTCNGSIGGCVEPDSIFCDPFEATFTFGALLLPGGCLSIGEVGTLVITE